MRQHTILSLSSYSYYLGITQGNTTKNNKNLVVLSIPNVNCKLSKLLYAAIFPYNFSVRLRELIS